MALTRAEALELNHPKKWIRLAYWVCSKDYLTDSLDGMDLHGMIRRSYHPRYRKDGEQDSKEKIRLLELGRM